MRASARLRLALLFAVAMALPALAPAGATEGPTAPRSGTIEGTVTDADTGLPIEGIFVDVDHLGEGGTGGFAVTDADGNYSVTVQHGEHIVRFFSFDLNYIAEYYDDATDEDDATPVRVAPGETVTGIDAALQPGGIISGTVIDEDTSDPVDGAFVSASAPGVSGAFAVTESDGTYRMAGLEAGTYTVRFSADGYRTEWFDSKFDPSSADPVLVTLGNETSGIDASLQRGGSISGTVTDADSSDPIPFAEVTVQSASGPFSIGSTTTDVDGTYTVSGLSPGDYVVEFEADTYLSEYYDDKPDFASADRITVGENQAVTGIDGELTRGGAIAGTVTEEGTGDPAGFIDVDVFDDNGDFVSGTFTSFDGTYVVDSLPTGTYFVRFGGFNAREEWYDDKPSLNAADPVSVTAPNVTDMIDAAVVLRSFGAGTGRCDIDGDGFDDVIVGVPEEAIGSRADAGQIAVIFGSATGLTAAGDESWHQNSAGIKGGSEAGDRFGYATACGDFNGDGFADAAVGAPGENNDSGAVHVILGSAGGLTAAGDQLWTQNSGGIKGTSEAGDMFGASLAAGDFNRDGFTDLAIGAPGENNDAGAVHVLLGGPSGLTAAGDQLWTQNSAGISGGAEPDDRFGESLFAGDMDGDDRADLAIGVPGEDIGSRTDAGIVQVLFADFFSDGGLDGPDLLLHQNVTGVPGTAEAGDRFGEALAGGDLDGNGVVDLVVGVPGEGLGSRNDAGQIQVFYGDFFSGLDPANTATFHQDTPGIKGVAETNDRFGHALAVGDFDGDFFADVAVGVYGENVGSIIDAGQINIIYGSSNGLSTRDQQFHQDTTGVLGKAEARDYFGYSLAAVDTNGDGCFDLAIGVPGEAIGDITGAGQINVLYGNSPGITTAGDQTFHQNTPGINGVAETGDGFGHDLAGTG